MTPTTDWQRACNLSELSEGQFLEFALTERNHMGDELSGFVFLRDGQVYAYLNRCPHLGIELNWMPGRFTDADNCFIQCATHGALFIPEDGQCIAGPCQGDALTPLEIRQDNELILVRVPE